jgi:hypothetical protein
MKIQAGLDKETRPVGMGDWIKRGKSKPYKACARMESAARAAVTSYFLPRAAE